MDFESKFKLFGMSHILVERDLDRMEKELSVDLQRQKSVEKDEDYYPQFSRALRTEAAKMGEHYELFYCLERSIRTLVAETLKSVHGDNWWDNHVIDAIRKNVENNIRREVDAGITPRSEEEIDFTTFGELGDIVKTNWSSFDSMFSSEKAFTKIMTSLNILRAPIASMCCRQCR